jgi:photosystem II stability/assembly factor-like uncharacterized protein
MVTVSALAASPHFAHDGICFAALDVGLQRSDDGGRTWASALAALTPDALTTTAIALSPAFPNDGTLLAGANGGVLRSADGGATWEALALQAPAPLITALALSPAFSSDGVALAATLEDGVLRSEDGGRTWHPWNFGLLDQSVLCLALSPRFATDETALAGTGSGLFRSTNGGRSWRTLALPAACPTVLSIAVTAGAILVGTEDHGGFCSEDDGSTWRPLGLPAGAVDTLLAGPRFPTEPALLALVGSSLLHSGDGGGTWVEIAAGVTTALAPEGFGPGAAILASLADGKLVRL